LSLLRVLLPGRRATQGSTGLANVKVYASSLIVTPLNFNASECVSFTVPVAFVNDPGQSDPNQLKAEINWGDGTPTSHINLVNSFHLAAGLQARLDTQLQAVQTDLPANNTPQACSDLTSFINHVKAQSGKGLAVSEANQLSAAATNIKNVLGC